MIRFHSTLWLTVAGRNTELRDKDKKDIAADVAFLAAFRVEGYL